MFGGDKLKAEMFAEIGVSFSYDSRVPKLAR